MGFKWLTTTTKANNNSLFHSFFFHFRYPKIKLKDENKSQFCYKELSALVCKSSTFTAVACYNTDLCQCLTAHALYEESFRCLYCMFQSSALACYNIVFWQFLLTAHGMKNHLSKLLGREKKYSHFNNKRAALISISLSLRGHDCVQEQFLQIFNKQ